MDKPGKTPCVSPTLPTGRRLPTSFTAPPQQHGMNLIPGKVKPSAGIPALAYSPRKLSKQPGPSHSAARSAMAEAATQFQKGLDQLALLPETPERQRQELEFCSSLGAALRFVKGQGAPEVGHAFARARELWERLGSPSEFLHVPYGQSRYH